MLSLALQNNQVWMQPKLSDPAYAAELTKGQAFSAQLDGRTIAVAGVMPKWAGSGLAWALLDRHVGPNFIGVHRAVYRFLQLASYRRLEMVVDAEHAPAIRWAGMLGFECEGRMAAYSVNGRDCFLYAKVDRQWRNM